MSARTLSARKDLFSRAFAAAPGRLHLAAHSHHLWPDATYGAHMRAWEDAAALADRKWDRALGEVWPKAQASTAAELGLPNPNTVLFAPNTHGLLLSLMSAVERRPVRVLSTDGEFHSFRRQAARWAEAGEIELTTIATETWADFPERFLAAAGDEYDLIFVSHVFFKTGLVFDRIWELADLARPEGPWVVVDGYHGFRAVPTDLGRVADRLFYVAGGYKYAMAGEGAAFLHAPPGFGPRPRISGWYAEFGDLEGPPGGVGFARDATRFFGATFDVSGVYRFAAAAEMLQAEGLTTAAVAEHVAGLQDQLIEALAGTPLGEARLINPLSNGPHARFLAFRDDRAAAWKQTLADQDVIVDVRDDVLRIGLSAYHDETDIDRFAGIAAKL